MRTGRAAAAGLGLAVVLGTAGCADEGVAYDQEEFEEVQTDVADLEERVGVLEEEAGRQ